VAGKPVGTKKKGRPVFSCTCPKQGQGLIVPRDQFRVRFSKGEKPKRPSFESFSGFSEPWWSPFIFLKKIPLIFHKFGHYIINIFNILNKIHIHLVFTI